jgi:hypothetical protein
VVAKVVGAARGAPPRRASGACPKATSGVGAYPGSDVGAGAGPGSGNVGVGAGAGPGSGDVGAPKLVPLTTMRLRAIAAAQNVGTGQTGITLSRTIGITFENWVLTMNKQIPRNTRSFLSPQRQNNTGGLPASVIPEYVSSLSLFSSGYPSPMVLPQSELWEVKAVTGTVLPSPSTGANSKLTSPTTPPMPVPADPDPPEVD